MSSSPEPRSPAETSAQRDTGALRRVMVQHARQAFRSQEHLAREWRSFGFLAEPDFDEALRQSDRLMELLGERGAEVLALPADEAAGIDSIYVRDAAIVCDEGAVLARMGKAARQHEPAAQRAFFEQQGLPIRGWITEPGRLEGGDVLWLDTRTLVVGRGYRTNDEGIQQLEELLDDVLLELVEVPLPHWKGPDDVFHLMSMISPLRPDLALVDAALLPVPFRELLLDRGVRLVEIVEEERSTLAANALALDRDSCLLLAGNPGTRARIEAAGIEVVELEGSEIALKGGGGPTCLTRPLAWSG